MTHSGKKKDRGSVETELNDNFIDSIVDVTTKLNLELLLDIRDELEKSNILLDNICKRRHYCSLSIKRDCTHFKHDINEKI